MGKELAFVGGSTGDIIAADVSISSTTGALLGLASDKRNVENAIQVLANNVMNIDGYLLGITVADYTGKVYPGVKINGVTNIYDSDAITDNNGFCLCKTSSTNPTLSVSSPYLDLADATISPLLLTGTVYEDTLVFNRKIGQDQTVGKIYVTSSGRYKFSPYLIKLDLCGVGGGGGSGGGVTEYSGGARYYPGAGGGGGHVVTLLDVSFESDVEYTFTIGHGGAGSSAPQANDGSELASTGGTTSISELGLSAAGGSGGVSAYGDSSDGSYIGMYGGSGNGNGGGSDSPTNGNEKGLDGELFGGGGAGGNYRTGGNPYGANMPTAHGSSQNGARGYGGGAAGTNGGPVLTSGDRQWFASARGGQGAAGVIVCKFYYE